MMRWLLRPLDRYVAGEWTKIFFSTALGFPLIVTIFDLTDNIDKYFNRNLTPKAIAMSYLYWIPDSMFMVMPAAVLFATVFTVGNLGRYSELTAAKAGGQSFFRLTLPIFMAAAGAAGLAFVIGELAPESTSRQLELQKSKVAKPRTARYNFVFRADQGWVYTIRSLDVQHRSLRMLVFERQGKGTEYPSLAITADSATYIDSLGSWRLWQGTSQRMAEGGEVQTFRFQTARLRALSQEPADLLAEPKAPEEMRYAELTRYIEALKRSGNDTSKIEVDRALKIALPAACLVIALFGAPLAVTSPRQGTAMGIAISLGTTVVYLTFIQLAKAIGVTGAVDPVAAAWAPNVLFLSAALWLLSRVRT